jgi:effector-binding domain-containing protein
MNFAPEVAEVLINAMPSGLALAIDHVGSVATLQASYDRLSRQAPANIELLDLTWEQYLTDPTTTSPIDQRTRVFRQARAR